MKRYIRPVICLLVAAGVQGSLPGCISIMGAMPDLVLVVLICFSLAEDPAFGAALGFVAGLIQGSVVGMGMGSLIVTRTITGFAAGLVSTRLFSANAIVPAFSVMWLTVMCGALFQLVNPRLAGPQAVGIVAGQCIHNVIFTFVIYTVIQFLETGRKNRIINSRF